jgi:cytochrome c
MITGRTLMRDAATRSMRGRFALLAAAFVTAVILAACGMNGSGEPLVTVQGGDPELGKAALDTYACTTCHSIPGVNDKGAYVGPPLDAWSERAFIAGNLANTPENLIAWIRNPQAIEPGTAMPTLGVTEEDARNIAAYLFTLED